MAGMPVKQFIELLEKEHKIRYCLLCNNDLLLVNNMENFSEFSLITTAPLTRRNISNVFWGRTKVRENPQFREFPISQNFG